MLGPDQAVPVYIFLKRIFIECHGVMISGVLLDLAGVIYEGEKALPGALDAVDRLRHVGLSLRFVTNTTRMTKHMVLQGLARRQCHGNSDSSAVRRRLASSDETDIV